MTDLSALRERITLARATPVIPAVSGQTFNTVLDAYQAQHCGQLSQTVVDRARAAATSEHLLTAVGDIPAGTGRSHAFVLVDTAVRTSGHRLFALTVTATVAAHLSAHLDTVHVMGAFLAEHRGDVLPAERSPRPGDVVLLIEPGLMSPSEVAAVLNLAEDAGALVVLFGEDCCPDA